MAAMLNSDHVNYLIWRYLQEHGYPHTAVQLMRDWGIDPQKLPFASSVHPYDLVSMLQDGLVYDELQAIAQYHLNGSANAQKSPQNVSATTKPDMTPNTLQRYGFINIQKRRRESSDEVDDDRSAAAPQNGSATRKRPRLTINGMQTSRNLLPRQISVNGDAVSADYEMSPIPREQTVEPEPLPSTLSVGESVGVQCEQESESVANTASETILTGSDIIHVSWSFSDSSSLLTTGGSIWRTWKVAGPKAPLWHDICPQGGPFYVTATARSSDHRIAVAFETENVYDGGTTHILIRGEDDSTDPQVHLLCSRNATVICLRWDPTSRYLLATSSQNTTPMTTIWDTETYRVLTEIETPNHPYDAAWVQNTHVILCGEEFLEYVDVRSTANLSTSISTKTNWSKVRYDSVTGKVACVAAATYDDELAILDLDKFEIRVRTPSQGQITAMEWQPLGTGEAQVATNTMRLLATSSSIGLIKLWNASNGLECMQTFNMDPAVDLAFSLSGLYMAAAGEKIIKVWKFNERSELAKDNGKLVKVYATWHALHDEADDANYSDDQQIQRHQERQVTTVNGNGSDNANDSDDKAMKEEKMEDDDEEVKQMAKEIGDPYYSLAFNRDESKIAFARGEKISVIDLPSASSILSSSPITTATPPDAAAIAATVNNSHTANAPDTSPIVVTTNTVAATAA